MIIMNLVFFKIIIFMNIGIHFSFALFNIKFSLKKKILMTLIFIKKMKFLSLKKLMQIFYFFFLQLKKE